MANVRDRTRDGDGACLVHPSAGIQSDVGPAALNPVLFAPVSAKLLNFELTTMMAEGEVFPCKLLRGGPHRDVRLEEMTHPADRALLQFLRLLPRVYCDLGVGRLRGDIDRGLQRMRWYIIWQHKHRRSAAPDKARDTLYRKSG